MDDGDSETAHATGQTKTVRHTVDLPRSQHTALASWRVEAAEAMGYTRLTTQDVLAGLVALLLTDDTVARRVRTKIAELDQRSGL